MSDRLDTLRALLRSHSALLADVDPRGLLPERLLVRSDAPGTMQLFERDADDLHPLTALPEPVGAARYLSGRRAVLEVDAGGNERHGLYVIDLDTARSAPATALGDLEALTED